MSEQETASIIKYLLDSLENITPYYNEVPQDFIVPSAYFPPPEVTTDADTLSSYSLEYTWYVKVFHRNSGQAYNLALRAITKIREDRNIIPLIDKNGDYTGENIKIFDPDLKTLDNGAVQIRIMWISRAPYKRIEAVQTQEYMFNIK